MGKEGIEMATVAQTKVVLGRRVYWFLAVAMVVVALAIALASWAGDSDSGASESPASATRVEDDPLFTRFGDRDATPDIEDDPLVVRYGDR
jgi:hypothetical protein